MRLHLLLVSTTFVALAAATVPAVAQDAEFERLRAAARKHEAERAKAPPPPPAAPRRSGPSLATYLPSAPSGWKMRRSPFDDGHGLIDLSQQASVDYVQLNGASGPSLEVTLLAHSTTIGGGAPKLGADKYSGFVTSQVSVGGRTGYLAWNAASKSGKLSLSVGRHQVLVEGREVAPAALTALAARIDMVKLSAL